MNESKVPAESGQSRVVIRHVSKTFGATRALRDVDLELYGGEIHALCGQNGSGKSTVIKILSAYHAPDHGAELTLDGEHIGLPLSPGQPERLGIRFVHQDLGLAGELSVLDNLYVDGHPRTRLGLIRWKRARRNAQQALHRLDLDVPLDRHVNQLLPAQRAILALARAMLPTAHGTETRVLILDEPTAQLPIADVRRMMQAIKAACAHGVAVMIVTHRLEEVLEYADRATVLRDGARVGTRVVADLDHDSLVEMLLGRSLDSQYPQVRSSRGQPLLELRGFVTGTIVNLDLTVDKGEVVGITGLVGAGFEDVPYGIFGAQPHQGEVVLDGATVHITRPGQAIDAAVALVPAERIGRSGVSSATLLENLTLPTMNAHRVGPFIARRKERAFTAKTLDKYDVRPPGSVDRHLGVLSGGNQQKLLMAKWLEWRPRLLLLHEPTQGVDIGSRRQLFDLVADSAGRGCGVLFASADYADLVGLCHRVVIFQRGRAVAELQRAELTEENIAERCLRDFSGATG